MPVSSSKNAPSVYLTVPNGDSWLHKHVHFAVCRMLGDSRFRIRHDCPTHRPFENNLHHCIHDWIDLNDEDYWLSIDADNPPVRNPLDLIQYDKDIIGCPTPVWHTGKPGDRPFYFNVYQYDEAAGAYRPWLDANPPRPGTPVESVGMHRVDAIGTGCFLVARRVFLDPEMRKAPFRRTLLADGRVEKGNDISFCERARMRGFEVWAHFGYLCRHFNELELTEVIRAFQGVRCG